MGINRTRHFAYLALLSAMAIALNIFESIYIGAIIGVLRIGLANIIALLTIKILGVKDMIIVNVMRVMIGSLMRGTIFGSTFWISAGGVILSSLVLIILDRMNSSLMFTSVMSAVAHSTGQVLIVITIYMQPGVAVLLPYLFLGSVPTGILTGYVSKMVLARVKPLRRRIEKDMNV